MLALLSVKKHPIPIPGKLKIYSRCIRVTWLPYMWQWKELQTCSHKLHKVVSCRPYTSPPADPAKHNGEHRSK